MNTVNIYDYLVIGAYFLFMLGIGTYFMRFNKGGKEYFAGGSMIPWWVSGMTLYMANFSAWTFTGAAGFAYKTTWFAILYFGIWSVAYFTGSQLTASKWRRTRSISPVEYTHTRFNVYTQQFLSWVIAINFTLTAGVQLAATCKLLAPVMGLDMTLVTVVTGVVILLYTFLGGLWAVSITDVVQGVLLLSITFTILPAALGLVGGVGNLVKALPALSLNQTYNNVHYTGHWLVAIFIIMCIGTAQGAAQRFYSVKDERDAKRVGKMAGILFLTVPFVFGVPPLVARVIWPDLSQVDFFKPYINKNPQDLVFVGICLKLLPNGLIGVFLAAMLASTMSALSNVYNMVSSVLSRDVYQGLFRPGMTDKDLLRVGRGFSIVIGIAVTVFAVSFVNSKFGIFNQMQTFFTLFNVPVIVPMAFGLLFRNPPKWSAVAATSWGLVIGSTARFVLGWDLGPQVYLSFALTAGIFLSSRLTGELYKTNKLALATLAFSLAVGIGILFTSTITDKGLPAAFPLAILSSALLGISLYGFAGLFASDSAEDKKTVKEFFKKLDTPVDVAVEVFGAGKKQISTFPIVGTIIIAMGLLMSLIFLTNIPHDQLTILAAMITIMLSIGVMMIYFGKKSEIRGGSGAAS